MLALDNETKINNTSSDVYQSMQDSLQGVTSSSSTSSSSTSSNSAPSLGLDSEEKKSIRLVPNYKLDNVCYHDKDLPKYFDVDAEIVKMSDTFTSALEDPDCKEIDLNVFTTSTSGKELQGGVNTTTLNNLVEFMKLQLMVKTRDTIAYEAEEKKYSRPRYTGPGSEHYTKLKPMELPKIVIGPIEKSQKVPKELVAFIGKLYEFKGCNCPPENRNKSIRHSFFDFYKGCKYIGNKYAYDLCNHYIASHIRRLNRVQMATELYGYEVKESDLKPNEMNFESKEGEEVKESTKST
jgi:hypothetical protein